MTDISSRWTAPEADVTLLLADTLGRLTARIERELNTDAAEGLPIDDPRWAATIAGIVQFAEQCVAVLDQPDVMAALKPVR